MEDHRPFARQLLYAIPEIYCAHIVEGPLHNAGIRIVLSTKASPPLAIVKIHRVSKIKGVSNVSQGLVYQIPALPYINTQDWRAAY